MKIEEIFKKVNKFKNLSVTERDYVIALIDLAYKLGKSEESKHVIDILAKHEN